jgi:hypothetical protein
MKENEFTKEELYEEFTEEDIERMVPDKPIVKVYVPYPVSGLKKESSRHTICDELRKAYLSIEAGDIEAGLLSIRIAMRMGKAMGTRLKEYNLRVSREMWPIKSSLRKGKVELDRRKEKGRV